MPPLPSPPYPFACLALQSSHCLVHHSLAYPVLALISFPCPAVPIPPLFHALFSALSWPFLEEPGPTGRAPGFALWLSPGPHSASGSSRPRPLRLRAPPIPAQPIPTRLSPPRPITAVLSTRPGSVRSVAARPLSPAPLPRSPEAPPRSLPQPRQVLLGLGKGRRGLPRGSREKEETSGSGRDRPRSSGGSRA